MIVPYVDREVDVVEILLAARITLGKLVSVAKGDKTMYEVADDLTQEDMALFFAFAAPLLVEGFEEIRREVLLQEGVARVDGIIRRRLPGLGC
jgi:hypothetical protein